MPRQPTQSRLSEHDIELIVSVVHCAWRDNRSVAQVVQHWLTQNWAALDMCLEDGDADAVRMITAETRRIRRLQRRFASWRAAESPAAGSRVDRPATPHRTPQPRLDAR